MMARQMIGGQERQSGRTPWRAAGLCGGADPSTGSGREDVPGAGDIVLKKNNYSKGMQ